MASRLFLDSNRMQFVWKDKKTATLYSIANSIYILENKIKNGENFPKQVIIDIYVNLSPDLIQNIERMLNILVQDVLCEDIKFILNKKNLPKVKDDTKFIECETICLFSGGVDSSIGILETLKKYKKVRGLYVAHRYTGRIDAKVENLNKLLLKPKSIFLEKFIAPEWRLSYSQTRGFLYLLYAGILSLFCNSKRILVTECGQTTYQPKFAPLDTITYTTHPYVLQIGKSIINIILERDIKVITPFEDFTKSELIKVNHDDSILSITHSCIMGMWENNCGKCYACITRMIGSINNCLSLSYFRNNAFLMPDNEDLNSLLNFCFNFIYHKEDLDFWSFRSIEHFGKTNLFERVADEVFLALSNLRKSGLLHPNYELLLDEYNNLDSLRIKKRALDLKTLKNPDFDKEIDLYKIPFSQ
jgi:7-cyano-7-deazaguanine synthase in queuosine biosynthesis